MTANWEVTEGAAHRVAGPNPKRVAAGRANRLLRRGLTEQGRERLRESIRRTQPWRMATGPRTEEGKRRSAENGRVRQRGERSVRQLRAELADVGLLLRGAIALRGLLAETTGAAGREPVPGTAGT